MSLALFASDEHKVFELDFFQITQAGEPTHPSEPTLEFDPKSQTITSAKRSFTPFFQGKTLVSAIGNPLTLACFSFVPTIEPASVGNFTTQAEAARACEEKQPDFLIVSDDLAQGYATALIKEVKAASPKTKCLLFLYRETQEVVRDAINAGCEGVCFVSSIGMGKEGDFTKALLAVSQGSTYYPQEVKDKAGFALKPLPDLSAKELEVLKALCLGLPNKGIAERLFLSTETVKTHISNLISKFGVSDRTAVVVTALRCGF